MSIKHFYTLQNTWNEKKSCPSFPTYHESEPFKVERLILKEKRTYVSCGSVDVKGVMIVQCDSVVLITKTQAHKVFWLLKHDFKIELVWSINQERAFNGKRENFGARLAGFS